MLSRLDLELTARRYGGKRLAAIAVAASLAVAMLATEFTPVAATRDTVEATDGNRQLEDRHRSFRGILIPRLELDARQRGVLDAAARHGLVAGRIDYGFEQNVAGRYGVATMQMPLRGRYADFRAFLAAALAAEPAMAVDDLAIQRDPAGIEARLRLAFHTTGDTVAGR